MARVLMDIGNTRIKYAVSGGSGVLDKSEELSVVAVLHGDFSQSELFERLKSSEKVEWLICSVNQFALGRLQSSIESVRPADVLRVIESTDLPVELQVDEPNVVGTDRVCAAVGALSISESGRDAIVVDAGTAVTIDVITADAHFLGGVIIPGITLAFKSLQAGTGALPRTSLGDGSFEPTSAIGKSTADAIRKGVVLSLRGGVQSIVNQLIDERQNKVDLFATGGDAQLISAGLPGCRISSDLVLRGLLQSRKQPA